MTSDFTGFDFLRAALHPVSDIRRGYGLGDATTPDTSTHGAIGSATTVDTTQHSTSMYLPLPQS